LHNGKSVCPSSVFRQQNLLASHCLAGQQACGWATNPPVAHWLDEDLETDSGRMGVSVKTLWGWENDPWFPGPAAAKLVAKGFPFDS
jgi:hypothetical protein